MNVFSFQTNNNPFSLAGRFSIKARMPLFRLCLEAELTETELGNLKEIHLKIGILSGIEPMFLNHAFQFMVTDSPFQHASLHIETIDVVAACTVCEHHFKVENFQFICPGCGRPTNKVIEGNELQIQKLILEVKEEPSHEEINQ